MLLTVFFFTDTDLFPYSFPPPHPPPPPTSAFGNFVSLPLFFTDAPSKIQNSSLPPSETFKLLLGCQYGHTIVRRIHTKVIRCVKMLLILTSTKNTKDTH